MRVSDVSVGVLVVSAAFLGCVAPVYTDALQSLKRFRALAIAEAGGAVFRFCVMLAAMPFRALAGYFAGQAALPFFRIASSVVALRRDLAVAPQPYWNRDAARRIALMFLAVLAYQAAPMAASLVELSILRTTLPATDSAGYFLASRFSDFLHYLTFPLLLVMFPYTAQSAKRCGSTLPYVLGCSAVTLVVASLAALVFSFCGGQLISLLPNGSGYVQYARYMPLLVASTALTACQIFYTNAEVSAGRFGFLKWLIPLHLLYPALLYIAARRADISLGALLAAFATASLTRFLFAMCALYAGKARPAQF